MKKTILSLVVLFCTVTSVNAQQLLKGDMNDDGDLTIGDVTALVEMIKNEERVYIDTSIGMFEPDNTTLYGTWETADHESIVIFDETGAVYNNKKYSYQYYPNLQKLVLSDTESGLTKVMLFVEKKSDTEISIFDNKIADFVLYDLSPEVVKVESITLSQKSLELTVDDTETIVATVLPEKAHQKVNWSSSDETIATVDEEGMVTAIAVGATTIICSATDGSGVFATCEVTIMPNATLVTDITLSQTSLELFIGKKSRIEATVLPEDADNTEVIWSSSDESVATVEAGMVKGVKAGTVTIICTAKDMSGVSATCEVYVDHEYVDLGLESGTLWATCNLGAEDPADIGDYFAWGEIEPKSMYDWSTYLRHSNGTNTSITKYCFDVTVWAGEGEPDKIRTLKSEDDAATQLWGEDWSMPTQTQVSELMGCPNTKFVTRQYNGKAIKGLEINRIFGLPSIFLPISGYLSGDTANIIDETFYWSKTNASESLTARALKIYTPVDREDYYLMRVVDQDRCYGITIRPVHRKK